MATESSEDLKQEIADYWNKGLQIWIKNNVLDEETKHSEAYQKEFRALVGNEQLKSLDVGTGFGFIATVFAKVGA